MTETIRSRVYAALPGTAKAIAQTTGLPLPSVRVALSRAKKEGLCVAEATAGTLEWTYRAATSGGRVVLGDEEGGR
jgi:hypothetical protein